MRRSRSPSSARLTTRSNGTRWARPGAVPSLDSGDQCHQCDPNHRDQALRAATITIETTEMNWARKGVLILLAAAICWSGLPGFDCLLTAQPMMQSDCCQAMPANCPMPDAGMSSSCCSTQPQNTSIAQDTSYSPEHPQKIFLVPHSVRSLETTSSDSVAQISVEAPPPRLTTGISILRI